MNSHPPRPPRQPDRRGSVVKAVILLVAGLLSTDAAAQSGPAGSVYQRGEQSTASNPPLPLATPNPLASPVPPVAAAVAEQGAAPAAQAGDLAPVGNPAPAGNLAQDAVRAERMVAAALAGLGKSESITARVRQLARVGDTVLKGGGRYLQSGTGEDQRFRFESRLSAETEEFEVLEVGDGLFFWTYRKLGSQPPTVTRIDIRRVRERLQGLKVPDPANASPYLGGIQRSLGLVREWFRFVSVSSAAIDDMPVWSIEGRWNGDRLASLLPAQAEAIKSVAGISAADLPEGLPWSVRLSIGKRALFPFRIEWLAIPGQRPIAATTPEVVAVLEFYDVRMGEPVDATAFVYKPATEGLMDVSEDYCRGLRRLRP
jgi:hypothetical protein